MKNEKFNLTQFKNDGERFLSSLVNELAAKQIQLSSMACDHLCYRVATPGEYEYYKSALLTAGHLLTEAAVNGRPISTFQLNQPFLTGQHTVNLVEIPFPKQGTAYETGFEHAEFILSQCFDTFQVQHPTLEFKISGNPILNPELVLSLGRKQVKFHHQPLNRVIEIEKAEITDIIFDFDGTLIESRENIYEINRIVFSQATAREISLKESTSKFHTEFAKLFEAFEVTCPHRKQQAVKSWGTVSSQFKYKLFEDILKILQRLYKKNVRLHLWTARDEISARKILKEHTIEHFFTTLSFGSETDSKPNTHSLKFDWKTAEKNKVLVIGDSPSDVYGAINIGAISASALWDPYATKAPLIAAGTDLFFHKVKDLEQWLTAKLNLP
jgi:HAD superfamily hydrolase (TIGR01549 family)